MFKAETNFQVSHFLHQLLEQLQIALLMLICKSSLQSSIQEFPILNPKGCQAILLLPCLLPTFRFYVKQFPGSECYHIKFIFFPQKVINLFCLLNSSRLTGVKSLEGVLNVWDILKMFWVKLPFRKRTLKWEVNKSVENQLQKCLNYMQ